MTKRQEWTVGKTLFNKWSSEIWTDPQKNEIRTFSDNIHKSILKMHQRRTWKLLEENVGRTLFEGILWQSKG